MLFSPVLTETFMLVEDEICADSRKESKQDERMIYLNQNKKLPIKQELFIDFLFCLRVMHKDCLCVSLRGN